MKTCWLEHSDKLKVTVLPILGFQTPFFVSSAAPKEGCLGFDVDITNTNAILRWTQNFGEDLKQRRMFD